MPAPLRPMANTAPAAILCGDPARALAIAQHVIAEPRMSNHHRGLWGYYGTAASGAPLTVHATGIGGPSAAIVLVELARRGLEAAVRVGTATSENGGPPVGTVALVREAVAGDGASAAYGAAPGEALRPDPPLSRRLATATDAEVSVRSLDRPRRRAPERAPEQGSRGAPEPEGSPVLYDLQTAALLAAGRERGVRIAAALVVSRDGAGPLEDDPLEAASLQLAAAAAAALAVDGPGSASS